MKVITLHVEESPDIESVYGEIADALDTLSYLPCFGRNRDEGHEAYLYLRDLAESARRMEVAHRKVTR